MGIPIPSVFTPKEKQYLSTSGVLGGIIISMFCLCYKIVYGSGYFAFSSCLKIFPLGYVIFLPRV